MVAFLKFQKVAFLLLFLLSTSFSFAQNHEAIRVYFHLGDSLVDENFKTNRESLSRLNQLIDKKGKNGGYSVTIVGTTSPEGLDEANQLLGLARANEVSKYVNRNGAIADSLLTKKSIGTDWVSVLENLKNVNFSFRDKATAIIKDKSISNGDKLLKLQSIESGKSLKYFNDSVYPFMRSAIITVAPISNLAYAKNDKLSNIYDADSKSKNGIDFLKYWWVLLVFALLGGTLFVLKKMKSNAYHFSTNSRSKYDDMDDNFKKHLKKNKVASKYYNDNKEYLHGFKKLSSIGLENDPDLCRYFSPDNMQNVEIQKTSKKGIYKLISADGEELGIIDRNKREIKANTFTNDKLNSIINQEYKYKGPQSDPDKIQTLVPNYTINIDNGQSVVKTDSLGRKVFQKDILKKVLIPLRNRSVQVNSKQLYNGYDEDQGGHTRAASFGGPRESINCTPMNKFVNEQGQIREFERECDVLLQDGNNVETETTFYYNEKYGVGGRLRPESYKKTMIVNGIRKKTIIIENPR